MRYCKFEKKQNEKRSCSILVILTQGSQLENSDNKIFHVKAEALEKQYVDAGYQKSDRNYKIKYQNNEYIVICLEFRSDTKVGEPILVIPEFLIPGRPYPVYVYLYAIELYCGSPEKGQRWAAGETRKFFKLETFAHTTLGRALKIFVRNMEEAANAMESIHEGTSCDNKEKSESQNENTCQKAPVKKSGFPTVQATEMLRKRAAPFLSGIANQAKKKQVIETVCCLVRKWFTEYHQLLL